MILFQIICENLINLQLQQNVRVNDIILSLPNIQSTQ